MHCKAVVANILPFRTEVSQSAKTNLVRSNYSAAEKANPLLERRPILEKGVKFLHFWPWLFTHSPGNGIRRTFLGYGENGKAAAAEHYSHSNSN